MMTCPGIPVTGSITIDGNTYTAGFDGRPASTSDANPSEWQGGYLANGNYSFWFPIPEGSESGTLGNVQFSAFEGQNLANTVYCVDAATYTRIADDPETNEARYRIDITQLSRIPPCDELPCAGKGVACAYDHAEPF